MGGVRGYGGAGWEVGMDTHHLMLRRRRVNGMILEI